MHVMSVAVLRWIGSSGERIGNEDTAGGEVVDVVYRETMHRPTKTGVEYQAGHSGMEGGSCEKKTWRRRGERKRVESEAMMLIEGRRSCGGMTVALGGKGSGPPRCDFLSFLARSLSLFALVFCEHHHTLHNVLPVSYLEIVFRGVLLSCPLSLSVDIIFPIHLTK